MPFEYFHQVQIYATIRLKGKFPHDWIKERQIRILRTITRLENDALTAVRHVWNGQYEGLKSKRFISIDLTHSQQVKLEIFQDSLKLFYTVT